MAPFVTIFSQPEYEPLELAFNEGTRNPEENRRNPILVQRTKNRKTVLSLGTKTELLIADTELWDALKNTLTPFRTLRFRQFIIGNIIKGIFILHKEKAKRFYEYCEKRFLKVFLHSFNKKLAEVIVLKKIYPGIPIFERQFYPPVRFDREYDEELWNRFHQDSRMPGQDEVERTPELPEAIQADRQVGEAASIDVPIQEPPQLNLLAAPLPMDVDRDVEGDLDHLFATGIHRHQEALDQIVGEYPRVSIPTVEATFHNVLQGGESLISADESQPLTEAERQPFEVHVEVHATERPAHSLETIRDDQLPAEPTSMDYLIADLRPETDTIRPEVDIVHPEGDTVHPGVDMVRLEVDTVHPTADIVTTQVEELQTRMSPMYVGDNLPELLLRTSIVPVEVLSLERPVDPLGAIQVERRVEEEMPRHHLITDQPPIEDLPIRPTPVGFVSGIERDSELLVSAAIRSDQPDFIHIAEETEPEARRTDVVDSPPIPVPPPVTVTVDVHFSERFPEPPVAIDGVRQADEATLMDHLITDLHPREDTGVPAQMEAIERDPNQTVSVNVRSEQPDQIVAEIVQPPVEELLAHTERDTGKEAEINIQQLQRDFDRIELVSVDEIEFPRVPTSRPDQLEIPGIVVTESERTRTDSVVEPEVVPESGRAEELMEVAPQPSRESRTIRISDLMREDASWEKARQKRAKRKIPVCFTAQQMKRMINRPLVKSADRPTLAAEVYTESRPNVLSPLRMLLQEPMDIHDMWEAPTNYADELKKNQQKNCKFTLQQMISFSHGIIFERLKPGYFGEVTEKEQKDREMGKKALRTIVNFPKIPSQVILRFCGEESPLKTRPSLRHAAEDQQLDIPGMARKSSIPQPRESQKSLAPDAAIPPRPSIEPYLVGEVLDRTVRDESIIVQLLPPEQVDITVPEEEINQTGVTGEPRTSVPVPSVGIGEDFNRLEAVEEARLPMPPAPSRLETVPEQIPPLPGRITAPEESLNRIEVIEDGTITMPTYTMTSTDDVHHLEAVQQPRPSVVAHIVAPEDVDRIEAAEQSRLTTEIPKKPLKHIVRSDVLHKLEFLLREIEGKVTFIDLCPPPPKDKKPEECPLESLITRNQAAETFLLLMELHAEKQVRLEYEVAQNICDSQIVIYSR